MCITKLGALNLPDYLLRGGQKALNLTKGFVRSKPYVKAKALSGRFANVASGATRPIVKGITATGKFIFEKPHIALPAAALGIYGAKQLGNNIYKNMYHIEPRYGITHSDAFGQIRYNDTAKENKYKEMNLLNI